MTRERKTKREKTIDELNVLKSELVKTTMMLSKHEETNSFESMVARRLANMVYQIEYDIEQYIQMYSNNEVVL